MSGRIGALAIRPSNGKFILGAAQGGIWLYDPRAGTWSAKTSDQTTQSIGALAVAPSNDAIVYAGTGEGALSGDSYFGDGVLKSTDGGNTWAKISDDKYFDGVSMSRIVVDPANADHVYAAVLRGRGGARRVSPPDPDTFGIWESKDGGVNWKLIQKAVKDNLGATDLEMDPQNSQILYSSFWGDAIYKSTDGGKKWKPVMNGLPVADYAGGADAVLDFDLAPDAGRLRHAVRRVRLDRRCRTSSEPRLQVDGRRGELERCSRAAPGRNEVEDYCGEPVLLRQRDRGRPDEPERRVRRRPVQLRHRLGRHLPLRRRRPDVDQPRLRPASGLPRARLQPGQHAAGADRQRRRRLVQQRPWRPADRGGSAQRGDWVSLNGTVNPATGAVTGRSNLAITQFTSIATVPQIPARFWGGTQDNGTLRKSGGSNSWFDVASGDGGQVLVDHTPTPVSAECPAGFAARLLRLRDVLRDLAVPHDGRRGVLLQQLLHPERDRPDRPVGLLHAVRAEPGEPEPALPRHVPALPHRQRQDAERR